MQPPPPLPLYWISIPTRFRNLLSKFLLTVPIFYPLVSPTFGALLPTGNLVGWGRSVARCEALILNSARQFFFSCNQFSRGRKEEEDWGKNANENEYRNRTLHAFTM